MLIRGSLFSELDSRPGFDWLYLKAIFEKHGSGVDSLPADVSTAALLPAEANGVTDDSRFEPFSESFV
jgi:hypothetical protein